MKHFSSFLVGVATAFAAGGDAHTAFTTLFINGVSQGDGTCVRMSNDPQTCTYPIAGVDSNDMACGVDGNQPVAFTCPASTGGKLTFEWRTWPDAEQPGSIDISHKGPCAVYAKQVQDMTKDSAAGPGWIKLWDEGYDESSGKWCTEKLIDNNGLLSFDIPSFLPGGYWLFRPELLALHDADKGDPQFYTGCSQIYIESDNTAALNVPAEYSVSIPGHVKASDPGLSFNIYSPKFPYPMPGSKVYKPVGSTSTSSRTQKQPKGLVPSNYLIKNANWVGLEVPDYSTEAGCWASSSACFDQAKTCYDSAPPSGGANCHVWENKCDDIMAACTAGNFKGPPNKGQKLQSKEPAPPSSIPDAVNAGNSRKLRARRARAMALGSS
ncbi:glycoside hydrolase family 61 protein [Hypoxylon sp. FL1857]|nr:glycoside hydrolase family 61 protein [Hypoxylon sp. FL1857]